MAAASTEHKVVVLPSAREFFVQQMRYFIGDSIEATTAAWDRLEAAGETSADDLIRNMNMIGAMIWPTHPTAPLDPWLTAHRQFFAGIVSPFLRAGLRHHLKSKMGLAAESDAPTTPLLWACVHCPAFALGLLDTPGVDLGLTDPTSTNYHWALWRSIAAGRSAVLVEELLGRTSDSVLNGAAEDSDGATWHPFAAAAAEAAAGRGAPGLFDAVATRVDDDGRRIVLTGQVVADALLKVAETPRSDETKSAACKQVADRIRQIDARTTTYRAIYSAANISGLLTPHIPVAGVVGLIDSYLIRREPPALQPYPLASTAAASD